MEKETELAKIFEKWDLNSFDLETIKRVTMCCEIAAHICDKHDMDTQILYAQLLLQSYQVSWAEAIHDDHMGE